MRTNGPRPSTRARGGSPIATPCAVLRATRAGSILSLAALSLPGAGWLSSNPMADALHALEKLADAADALETGAGSVHERLFEAFTDLVLIGPEDMPDGELRLAFAELMGALTAEEAKGTEGRLVATLKVMDEEQAQNIARAIVDLYHALGRRLHER
jgi:hypothetical protein